MKTTNKPEIDLDTLEGRVSRVLHGQTKMGLLCREMAEILWVIREFRKTNEALGVYKTWSQKLLNKVNLVTAPHRHGFKVSENYLTELANRQIDFEEAITKVEQDK